MGGNAFRAFDGVSLPAADALRIGRDVQQILQHIALGCGLNLAFPLLESYRQKERYGDIDVMVPAELLQQVSPEELAKEFALLTPDVAPLPFRRETPESPVINYALRLRSGGAFQVDLLVQPTATLDFALRFYSWNDLGFLMAQTAGRLGLRLAPNGLWLDHQEAVSRGLEGRIRVTDDFDTALGILGFDPERHRAGFDNLEGIFRFVLAGKFFDWGTYPIEACNAKQRKNLERRPTQKAFAEWLPEQRRLRAGIPATDAYIARLRATVLADVFSRFPEVEARIKHAEDTLLAQIAIKARFDGNLVKHVTGLEGEALGSAMAKLKGKFESQAALQAFLDSKSDAAIRAWIAEETIDSGFPEGHPVQEAARFAAAAHAYIDQRRKYTGEPYIRHPEEVASIVATVSDDIVELMASWLHDVVEDTEVTEDDVRAAFGDEVGDVVMGLTDVSKPEDGNREIRKAIDREHSAGGCARTQTVKLADITSNTSSIVKYDPGFAVGYLKEKALLLKVLIRGNRELHARAIEASRQGWLQLEELQAEKRKVAKP